MRATAASFILCLAILALFVFESSWAVEVTKGCTFPSYLYQTEEPWKILSPDRELEATYKHRFQKYTFIESQIYVYLIEMISPQNIVFSYNYRCQRKVSHDIFILAKEISDTLVSYSCISFVKRGDSVVQLRTSRGVSDIATLGQCAGDMLVLQEAPLTVFNSGFYMTRDEHRRTESSERCPLVGGYVVISVISSKWIRCFLKTPKPLKVENECAKNEGLLFVAMDTSCRYSEEHYLRNYAPLLAGSYRCQAQWKEYNLQYAVIHHQWEYQFRMPCLRYDPNENAADLDLMVFLDGVCYAPHQRMVNTTNYLKLKLKRLKSQGLCSDDRYVCGSNNCSPPNASYCLRSCDACNNLRYEPVGSRLRGQWRVEEETTALLMINRTHFDIPGIGQLRVIRESFCYGGLRAWKNFYLNTGGTEYLLSSVAEKGCTARLSTILVVTRSPLVISYKLSNQKLRHIPTITNATTGQLELSNDEDDWCSGLSYRASNTDSIFPVQKDWITVVKNTEEVTYSTACYLNVSIATTLSFYSNSNKQCCDAELITIESNDFVIHYRSCATVKTGSNGERKMCLNNATTYVENWRRKEKELVHYQVSKRERYTCIASFWDLNRQVVIGRNTADGAQRKHVCWLFTHSPGVVLVLPVSSCNAHVEREVLRRHSEPAHPVIAELYFPSLSAGTAGIATNIRALLVMMICYSFSLTKAMFCYC